MASVLVVDDDPEIRLFLRTALKAAGHSTFEATNGQEALDAIEAGHPDVVLLDVMMPLVDGWTTLERLQTQADRPPVIALTARTALQERVRALELGAEAFVGKPFLPDDVLDTIERVLRLPPSDRRLTSRGPDTFAQLAGEPRSD